jgi:hypothetical protein
LCDEEDAGRPTSDKHANAHVTCQKSRKNIISQENLSNKLHLQLKKRKGTPLSGGHAVLPCKAALETYFNVKLRVRSPGDEGKSLNSTFTWADLLNANMIQNIQI